MGPDNRRILLATVLSVGILILWQVIFPTKKVPPKPAPPPAAEVAKPAAPASPAPGAAAPAVPAPPPDAPEETVKLAGKGFEATLTTYGGALKSLRLEGDKFRKQEKDREVQIDLVHVTDGQPYPLSLSASPELGGAADVAADPGARAPMRIVAKDASSVTFEGRVGNLAARKTFRVTGKPYELALDVELSGGAGNGTVGVLYPAFMPPDTKSGGIFSGPPLDFVRPVCRAGTTTERFDLAKEGAPEKLEGQVSWAGVDQHYFVAAVLPAEPIGTCTFVRGPVKGAGLAALAVPVEGGARKLSLTVYAGPKDLDTLRGYGRGFESAIDYGAVAKFFALFARGLLYVMRWLEAIVRNWGVAIILLTVLVRLVLFPLTYKSMQSMNEMRKLQPEIEKLKAKFGDDREKMNLAVMQLYQKHKVNPLGGCLPMLLQMPVWFALYAALQTSVELYREPFLWMKDLTAHDPYFILPIAMGISSFVMQKLSPQPADNAQAKMMLYFFPGFFTVIMLFVPGGLTLYIFVNNLLSIVQQQLMMKHQQAAPAPAAGK
ncbi:60 kDa inner membrane insertion protein [Anaeromyxobacter sp. K]|uniref:Membrane protein insertase YidC n=1 Tax=Anaeromyxobacter sp. (strain K) TaxID=447217 RepID=YIDC_ANASK|nr:membrane protein insertase YidC [Anaeromyxobacter sp. K]B4UKG1.1 RecName: Full=Membrane protein insertase YidC; AltName: Full=Foldase YidC; AltName: Full=Membrane integrase YidC; AltName: Full=Membrane protein YidC [Anaeromyxobacter sp. K]ACG75697.1 60 kDa inner membrane insertion protein [Anaeromyxobacter sp. K]